MLSKTILTFIFLASTAHATDQALTYGFGKYVTDNPVTKSGGNVIYDKHEKNAWYKVVSNKNKFVTRLYNDRTGTYTQYTKLDSNGKVLGQVQCKFKRPIMITSCDVQTASICKELIGKVESGKFDVDLNKIKECAEVSAKVNYSHTGTDELFNEAIEQIKMTALGGIPSPVRSTPSSLQTLVKDYNACKTVESELSEQTDKPVAAKPATANYKPAAQ